jgi:hypothetical protein
VSRILSPVAAAAAPRYFLIDAIFLSAVTIGEVLKTFLVERLFHFSRDKLMTIPAFARV